MVEMALSWTTQDLTTVIDLIARLGGLDETYQARVWNLVKSWAATKATDTEKAALREKIRVTTMTRWAIMRAKEKRSAAAATRAAREAYAVLEPADLLNKHAWLFHRPWVEESYDEIHGDEEIDFQKHDERIAALRTDALREVFARQGFYGVLALAERGNAATQIGWLCATALLSPDQLMELVRVALVPILAGEAETFPRKNLIAAVMRARADDERETLLRQILEGLYEDGKAQVLLLAPFCRSTWKFVDALGTAAQEKYWEGVAPDWIAQSDDENNEAVERFLKAERPRAAFECIHFYPESLMLRLCFGCSPIWLRAEKISRAIIS